MRTYGNHRTYHEPRLEGRRVSSCTLSLSDCDHCWVEGPESATIHVDCFCLFRKIYERGDAIRRLWIVSTWRQPWHPLERLDLPTTVCLDGFMQNASKMFTGFRRLPPEVALMIKEELGPHAVTRYSCVTQMVSNLARSTQSSGATFLPLCEVEFWTRWQAACPSGGVRRKPFMRLTIDCLGLRDVEQVDNVESGHYTSSDSLAYVVERSELFFGVLIRLEVCRSV
jgi:hypothetical protein